MTQVDPSPGRPGTVPVSCRSGTLLATLLLAMTGGVASDANAQTGEFDSHGADEVRIEHETKLKVPLEQCDEVWDWLLQRYSDCGWLESTGRSFSASFGDEDFRDVYFDTPDLVLLQEQSGVRHRTRVVNSGPADEKDGRELLQIKLDRGDATGLARSEIKFEVTPTRSLRTLDEAHPMIGLVKKSLREECKSVLRELGFDPYEMQPILTLHQNRRRVYLNDRDGAFATLTLDLCSTESWATDLRWAECELELNEIRYTEAREDERERMERVMELVKGDLVQSFPEMRQDQTPKYNTSFAAIQEATWLPMRLLIRWKVSAAEFIGLSVIAVLAACAAGAWFGARRLLGKRPAEVPAAAVRAA